MRINIKHTIFFLLWSNFSFASMPELILRADQYNPHILPDWSKMSGTSPACNNNGISIKFLSLFGDEKLHPAVVQIQNKEPSFSKPFNNDISVSGVFLTTKNESIFSLNYPGGTEGVYKLSLNGLKKIIKPSDFPNTTAMSRPSIVNNKVLFRSLNKDRLHTIYLGKNTLLEEAHNIAYLYLPTSKNDQIALKVGYGTPGKVGRRNKDKIIFINEHNIKQTVAFDKDFDSKSKFVSFDNSPIPDGNGGVVFIAEHEDHGRSLWHYTKNKYKLIFSGKNGSEELEFFSPAVNSQGDIVFRIIKGKRRHILLWSSKIQEITSLLSQGQIVVGNENSLRIIDREKWPAFSGKPCINKNGEVFIHAILENLKTRKNKGSAVFKFKPQVN